MARRPPHKGGPAPGLAPASTFDDPSIKQALGMKGILQQLMRRWWLAITVLAVAAGCQPSNSGPTATARTHDVNQGLAQPVDTGGPPPDADTALDADPCTVRLSNITFALTQYLAVNKQLPTRLDELATYTDANQPLVLTCPLSGLPYVYVPGGLLAPGKTKKIIIYDASAAHRGSRWCIFMAPSRPGGAQSFEVLRVPEAVFRTYTPVIVGK
jgi:hypothetical protein